MTPNTNTNTNTNMNYIDVKYIQLLSPRLLMFKKTNANVYNFRCPICGDSQKSELKARGFIFEVKGSLRYKCHNCLESLTFKNFLKVVDSELHRDYVVERYKNRRNNQNSVETTTDLQFSKPSSSVLSCCTPLYRLPKDHKCVKYVKSRGISYRHFQDLYYLEDINTLTSKLDAYTDKKFKKDGKLVIPYINENGKLTHIQLRTVDGQGIRYITLALDATAKKVYGLDKIDYGKEIRVVEGPIDSLFIFNSIASGDINLIGLSGYSDNMVFIFDKQPRNKALVDQVEKAIDMNLKICLLPKSLVGKDINDFVMAGVNIETVIRENTYKGLKSKLEFAKWRKI